ncbi:hypothetical protein AAVH_17980 [Aphelenchoides avenae]|nr:hypothetical protein AAVH_17980 [Aphelenchus avenae]
MDNVDWDGVAVAIIYALPVFLAIFLHWAEEALERWCERKNAEWQREYGCPHDGQCRRPGVNEGDD